MNDTFYYACADCEPFKYEDAPMLWEIAKTEGWPGLVKWASEQRAARGEDHEPLARVKESMEVSRDNLAEANTRTAKAELALENERMQRILLSNSEVVRHRDQAFEEAARVLDAEAETLPTIPDFPLDGNRHDGAIRKRVKELAATIRIMKKGYRND
jgi:hypothetical protein